MELVKNKVQGKVQKHSVEIIELLQNGFTAKEIAKEYECTVSAVYRVKKEYLEKHPEVQVTKLEGDRRATELHKSEIKKKLNIGDEKRYTYRCYLDNLQFPIYVKTTKTLRAISSDAKDSEYILFEGILIRKSDIKLLELSEN